MILIERASELENSKKYLEGVKIFACDSETTGLDVYTSKLRLVQLATPQETLVIDVFKTGLSPVAEFLAPVLEDSESVKIFHNGKFDMKFYKRHLNIDVNKPYDSFLASILLEGGVNKGRGYHRLDSTLERYTGIKIVKDEQLSDWSGVLTQKQLSYAAEDVNHLFSLREAQIDKLKEKKLTKVAKLEFEAILPVVWLELCGFYLDMDEWVKVAEARLADAYESAAKIYELLEPVIEQQVLFGEPKINLGSPQQVQKYFRALGVPMPESTKEFFLKPLIKDYPIVELLLKYKKDLKAFNTFGEAYREFINPVTGRIHADFYQLGTETGRFSCSKPNLTQIPRDPRHRSCFKSESGNVLITSDFSQEELRILADFSGDVVFKDMFFSGYDFHSTTAHNLFGADIENPTPDERDMAKRCNFGISYCMQAQKLAMTANISVIEAQEIIDIYFGKFKGVKRWMDYQKFIGRTYKCARSASGRWMKYNYTEGNWAEIAAVERNAVNAPIQATASDILKRALRLFYDVAKPYGNDVKLVNVVHDEIIIETKNELADEVSQLLKDKMIEAGKEYIKSVPIEVDSKKLYAWKK